MQDPKSPKADDNPEPDLKKSADSPEHSTDSSQKHWLTNKIEPGQSVKRAAQLGRTSGKKNRPMESVNVSPKDSIEVERLEITKAELQNGIEEELYNAKSNAVLLEKHKISLHEQRLELEQDVARLNEQLQKERDLRAALEAVLKSFDGGLLLSSSIDDKVKAELEDVAAAEADVANLRQKADDLTLQLNQHRQLKDKQDAVASIKRSSEKSARNKSDPVHNSKDAGPMSDEEKDVKHGPTSTNDHAPQSASVRSSTNSKRHSSRGEGTTSANNTLSKLTNRLHFLKEKRTQITSENQNHDKRRSQGQPVQNSEGHSSEKSKGLDHTSDKGVSAEGSSAQNTDRDRRSDAHGIPNLERGKSEIMDKKRNVAPPRTLSR